MINNTYSGPKLDLAGVGKPKVQGITNLSLVPDSVKKNASLTTTKPAAPAVSPAKTPVAPAVDRNAELERIKNEALRIQSQIGQMQPQTSTAPVKGLLPSVSGSIKGATPAPAAPTYGGLVGTLAERAQTLSPEVQESYKQAQKYNENLGKFRSSVADTTQGIYSAPTSARVMQGRDQAVQLANAQKEAAIASQFEAASNLYGTATTGQGQQLTALGTAAGLAAPVQVAPGSTLASPLSGETVAGGLGGYANYQTAEQVMNLIRQYPDAGYVYDQTKTPQENLQTFQGSALQRSPTYQKETYGQPGAGSVVQGAQLGSAADLTRQASEIQAIANGAEANFSLLVDTARRGGVNDSTVPALNRLQQNVQRGLASAEAVALFRATLESVRAQYASILGGGQATDQARNAANAQIPDDISLAALTALETQLKYEAQNRVAGYQNQISSLTNRTSPSQASGSGSIWDF